MHMDTTRAQHDIERTHVRHPQAHPDGDSSRKSSLSTAIFHTWNATIGVGILAMPRAFALVGWATGSVMLVVFGL
jgi:hypothetical protein